MLSVNCDRYHDAITPRAAAGLSFTTLASAANPRAEAYQIVDCLLFPTAPMCYNAGPGQTAVIGMAGPAFPLQTMQFFTYDTTTFVVRPTSVYNATLFNLATQPFVTAKLGWSSGGGFVNASTYSVPL